MSKIVKIPASEFYDIIKRLKKCIKERKMYKKIITQYNINAKKHNSKK